MTEKRYRISFKNQKESLSKAEIVELHLFGIDQPQQLPMPNYLVCLFLAIPVQKKAGAVIQLGNIQIFCNQNKSLLAAFEFSEIIQ